ncbi:uncharacterized protein LOC108487615 [Gossypium arboreum]|uniref:uncharacterized protein LOC108487615 n=1 Tax=Gossypium arboreum TaxID=29729 RepID=UPI0022F157B9|nr:uncharacterized protein LOC108487615 [Gossypium arboreum]
MQLGAMFAIWYILNIYFNIFNKQVLKVYTFPATVTAFHFGCGTLMILIMWASNLYHRPKLTRSQLAVIIPLAIVHTLGNLLTNVSIGRVNVSFTHTIKAMEPFFIVLFSVLFLREWPTFWIVFSLIPVVGGVALASFTEASFNCTIYNMCTQKFFEEDLLQDTSAYYSRKASSWIEEDSCPEYMLKSEECLRKERERVSHYLHSSSETKLLKKVQHELLVTYANWLLEKEHSGCRALLRDDKVEDLSRMYRLYCKIPRGLEPVANVFKQHVTAEGTALVQQAEDAVSNYVNFVVVLLHPIL